MHTVERPEPKTDAAAAPPVGASVDEPQLPAVPGSPPFRGLWGLDEPTWRHNWLGQGRLFDPPC